MGETGIKWPGKDAPIEAHVQYFIDSMRHIASTPIAPDRHYKQVAHAHEDDAGTVGNPKIPALLNASYHHLSTSVISFSVPDFVSFDPLAIMVDKHSNRISKLLGEWRSKCTGYEPKRMERGTGFNMMNLSTSLHAILDHFGIASEERGGKHERVFITVYAEFNLDDPAQYPYANALMNMIVHGRDKTAAQLLQDMQAIPAIPATPAAAPSPP